MIEIQQLDQTREVQRIDAQLRSRFPNLITEIFQVSAYRFLLYFDRKFQAADRIEQEFKEKICFVAVSVELSNQRPKNFINRIPNLSDAEASGSLTGLPLREIDIYNIITARFPDLPLAGICPDRPTVHTVFQGSPMSNVEKEPKALLIWIELTKQISEETEAQLIKFCDQFNLTLIFKTRVITTSPIPPKIPDENPMFIWSARMRPQSPSFVQLDEAFWFDNIEKIGSGDISRDNFPGIRKDAFRCFLDLTIGSHINLRQALLLYDQAYCALPLANEHEKFLGQQKLSEEDLLALVVSGRLKFVTTLPEERLDVRFLEAAFERRPDCILGRRSTAALLLSDIIRSAEEYRLGDPAIFHLLPEIAKHTSPIFGQEPDDVLRTLLWPLKARREALSHLLDRGSKGIINLGIPDAVSARIKLATGFDMTFESMVLAERVHVGHALGATVFGPIDEPESNYALMNAIGNQLNFYQSFNSALGAAWVANEKRRAAGFQIMPSIPLFEFEVRVPIDEFLDETALYSTRSKGRQLFSRLAEMPTELRGDEINRLSTRMRKLSREREGRLISFDNADTAISIASLVFGFFYPPVVGLKNFGSQILDFLRRNPSIDKLFQDIELDTLSFLGKNQDIDFLSKINRVASFRSERV